MKYIYDNIGELISIKYQGIDEEFKNEFGEDIYISDENLGEKAIIENNNLRAYTRVDRIKRNFEKLQQGEYIQNNKIIIIERPNNFHIWNPETNKWNYNKQLEVNSLNEELSDLESNLLSKYDELEKAITRKLKTLEKKLDTEIKELIILIDEKYSKLKLLNKS